ncbi:hypothetical protein ABT001_35745, partial [Streptomyces sp. NPDC002793]|uniref:hypothetical protein n=1 Tax=Streptomyces sp. NPDC002793 TaxID=3154432 RepID=UPI0033278B4F
SLMGKFENPQSHIVITSDHLQQIADVLTPYLHPGVSTRREQVTADGSDLDDELASSDAMPAVSYGQAGTPLLIQPTAGRSGLPAARGVDFEGQGGEVESSSVQGEYAWSDSGGSAQRLVEALDAWRPSDTESDVESVAAFDGASVGSGVLDASSSLSKPPSLTMSWADESPMWDVMPEVGAAPLVRDPWWKVPSWGERVVRNTLEGWWLGLRGPGRVPASGEEHPAAHELVHGFGVRDDDAPPQALLTPGGRGKQVLSAGESSLMGEFVILDTESDVESVALLKSSRSSAGGSPSLQVLEVGAAPLVRDSGWKMPSWGRNVVRNKVMGWLGLRGPGRVSASGEEPGQGVAVPAAGRLAESGEVVPSADSPSAGTSQAPQPTSVDPALARRSFESGELAHSVASGGGGRFDHPSASSERDQTEQTRRVPTEPHGADVRSGTGRAASESGEGIGDALTGSGGAVGADVNQVSPADVTAGAASPARSVRGHQEPLAAGGGTLPGQNPNQTAAEEDLSAKIADLLRSPAVLEVPVELSDLQAAKLPISQGDRAMWVLQSTWPLGAFEPAQRQAMLASSPRLFREAERRFSGGTEEPEESSGQGPRTDAEGSAEHRLQGSVNDARPVMESGTPPAGDFRGSLDSLPEISSVSGATDTDPDELAGKPILQVADELRVSLADSISESDFDDLRDGRDRWGSESSAELSELSGSDADTDLDPVASDADTDLGSLAGLEFGSDSSDELSLSGSRVSLEDPVFVFDFDALRDGRDRWGSESSAELRELSGSRVSLEDPVFVFDFDALRDGRDRWGWESSAELRELSGSRVSLADSISESDFDDLRDGRDRWGSESSAELSELSGSDGSDTDLDSTAG